MTRGTYKTKPEPGSWAALIVAFRASPKYRAWAPLTRKHADRVMDDFRIANGREQVASLDMPAIILMRDSLSETPDAANNWLKVMRHLLKYAKRTGFIAENPLADGLEKLPPHHPGGHRTWRDDEIAAYREHHTEGIARLVFELALGTGAAVVDLPRLRPEIMNQRLARVFDRMALNKTRADGTKWCAQCKAWLPEDRFARMPKGWRVTGCNDCGRENMARWARSGMVGRLPEDFDLRD